jgi:hypothetical protein
LVMAISIGFLVSLLLRAWLRKSRHSASSAKPARPSPPAVEDKAHDQKGDL